MLKKVQSVDNPTTHLDPLKSLAEEEEFLLSLKEKKEKRVDRMKMRGR